MVAQVGCNKFIVLTEVDFCIVFNLLNYSNTSKAMFWNLMPNLMMQMTKKTLMITSLASIK